VLQAICDLTPPVSQFSGPECADAVERACDRVIAECVSLDPPQGRGPVRASDGRSVWLAPTEPHLTHEGVLAQEERIVLFAAEAHDAPPRPSATVEREGLDVLQADAAAAVAGPTVSYTAPEHARRSLLCPWLSGRRRLAVGRLPAVFPRRERPCEQPPVATG